MYFNNTNMGLKGFFTTDSISLVSSSKNDENMVNIRVGDYNNYFGHLFVVLSITLMLTNDGNKEFGLAVKNSA